MKSLYAHLCLLTLFAYSPAFALEAACEPLLKSSEAKLAQTSWRAQHSAGEAIKIADKSYMKIEGKWIESPLDLDQVEKQVIESMKSGELKVTGCKQEGTEELDGKAVLVFVYTAEIPNSGMPAATAKLYIGKEDGLPYLQTGIDEKDPMKVTYTYKDITAPQL